MASRATVGFATADLSSVISRRTALSGPVLSALLAAGADSVELHAQDTDTLLGINPDTLGGFERVTLHAPDLGSIDWREAGEYVSATESRLDELRISCVVLHPDWFSVGDGWDFSLFAGSRLPLALENRGMAVLGGRSVEGVAEAMVALQSVTGRRVGFVLDAAHAFEIDSSGELAVRLLRAFGKRLCEVHISGVDDTNCHALLHVTGQGQILDCIPDGTHIVVESMVNRVSELEDEMAWVRTRLASRGHRPGMPERDSFGGGTWVTG